MTAATLTGTPLKERLTDVLGALDFTPPGSCPACLARADGFCEPCTALREADETVNGAITAISAAPSGDIALAVYVQCFLKLTGIPEADWGVAIVPAAAGGAE